LRRGGETGRRTGLKILRAHKARVGSTPTPGTRALDAWDRELAEIVAGREVAYGRPRMNYRRSIGNVLAMLFLLAGTAWSGSWLANGMRYLAFGYISIDILLRARAGYLRRRPYWTLDSWRRYLKACSVPVGALAIMVFMMVALEWRLPFVGVSRSTTRGLWAAGTLLFMVIGVGGLVSGIEWLNRGDPSRQCALPRWLTFGRGKTA
jgi:hypothetical protein